MKKILLFAWLMASINTANTCTTFFLQHNGQMVFGRNYDWVADAGMVCTNQRGLMKTSIKNPDGNTISWVSLYGSITFNQYGKEFPTGGMNEKGLVVELMWLDGTAYPQPDERASVGVLQWIQYQLDNHSNIEEVIASDKIIRITSKGTPLHYLVADANGHAASIEFLDGKMNVHIGNDLPMPVLTNDTYTHSITSHANNSAQGNNSLERFSTACNMLQQYKSETSGKSLVDESFAILDKVAQGNYTKWSIVYDISNKQVWFKTEKYKQLRLINFSSFDFSCTVPSKLINMNGREEGDISKLFNDFSDAKNKLVFEQTVKQSSSQITLTRSQKEATLAYPATIHCK
ncbi:MAG: linear amide C-N hydrolase [Chitinophagaceae bacterium]